MYFHGIISLYLGMCVLVIVEWKLNAMTAVQCVVSLQSHGFDGVLPGFSGSIHCLDFWLRFEYF